MARELRDEPITGTTSDRGARTEWSELTQGLVQDLKDLGQQQMALAKLELQKNAKNWVRSAIIAGVGAAAGLFFLQFLLVFFAMVLHEAAGLSLWASFGIVTLVLALVLVGCALALRAIFKKSDALVPKKTVETASENIAYLKARTLG